MKLSSTMQKFVLHWGETGSRWGVYRTVAQIHALPFLANDPMNTEAISETLDFLEQTTGWFDQMRRLERPTLLKLLKLGGKVESLLNLRR